MFSHKKLDKLPPCKVIRFNIEYTILYYEEKFPQNFTVKELDGFSKYIGLAIPHCKCTELEELTL